MRTAKKDLLTYCYSYPSVITEKKRKAFKSFDSKHLKNTKPRLLSEGKKHAQNDSINRLKILGKAFI